SFPEDLPSRVGFEIMEEKFNKGDLAQTTVLVSGEDLNEEQLQEIADSFQEEEQIGTIRPSGITEDGEYGKITVSLKDNPYGTEAIDFLEGFREDNGTYTLSNDATVDLMYAGMTAQLVDEQQVNNSDIKKIVVLETLLLLVLLFFLTRSV